MGIVGGVLLGAQERAALVTPVEAGILIVDVAYLGHRRLVGGKEVLIHWFSVGKFASIT